MALPVKRISSTHIASKRVATLDYRDIGAEVSYPSDWFEKNGVHQPSTTVPKFEGDIGDLIKAVKGGIGSVSLTMKTVKMYLHHFGESMEERLEEDWTSFGVEIGKKGEVVGPWNLVTITEGDPHKPTEALYQPTSRGPRVAPDDPQEWSEKAMALYILCIYRLIKISNEEYADLLQKRMEDQLSAEGGKGISFYGVRGIYGGWLSDKGFLKLVAAIDMFLHKFKDSKLSLLRLGSLGSRFRDCAGLLTFGYAMTILNIEAGDLMDWIFIKTMADEVSQITREGQETGQPDSYFPYQADLGLVIKSAYSSNANPYLFTWIHIIGSLIGHRRSQNARFIFEGNYADVGLNAVVLSWVYARGGELAPLIDAQGQDYGLEVEMLGGDEAEGEGYSPEDLIWINTQGQDPTTWYAILKRGGFKAPRVVNKAMRRQREKIRDVRQDSVGEYVKNRLIF